MKIAIKKLSDNNYGVTVNERLVSTNLLEYEAVAQKKQLEMFDESFINDILEKAVV